MGNKVLTAILTAGVCLMGSTASAQTDLATGGAHTVWNGTSANSRAGAWFDQGPVSAGSGAGRRDLIIGAPGTAAIPGKVHLLFSGTLPTGQQSLSNAHTL